MKIKICGLTREEDILAVNEAMPDYIGFVFAESRRRVTPEQAGRLKRLLAPGIHAVGVFVDAPADAVLRLAECGLVDAVQLHGLEDAAYLSRLKERIGCPIIKAVRVTSADVILAAENLPCDMLLLDSFHQGVPGGSGKTFDHSMIPALRKPYFIAGGLHPGNLAPVAERYRPFGVDLSSGVETDGVKDREKILSSVRAIRKIPE